MAGTSNYQDGEGMNAISDINVTPLVDVVLVLLIIFMVTAKLIVARGINVDSPKTASGADVKSTMQVSMDKDLRLYVNGHEFADMESAKAKVRELRGDNPDFKAIIQADQRVPHGEVMKIIDFVKLAGVTKFALTADPLPTGGEGGGR